MSGGTILAMTHKIAAKIKQERINYETYITSYRLCGGNKSVYKYATDNRFPYTKIYMGVIMKNRKFKVVRKEYWEMETVIEAPTADKAEEIIINK